MWDIRGPSSCMLGLECACARLLAPLGFCGRTELGRPFPVFAKISPVPPQKEHRTHPTLHTRRPWVTSQVQKRGNRKAPDVSHASPRFRCASERVGLQDGFWHIRSAHSGGVPASCDAIRPPGTRGPCQEHDGRPMRPMRPPRAASVALWPGPRRRPPPPQTP